MGHHPVKKTAMQPVTSGKSSRALSPNPPTEEEEGVRSSVDLEAQDAPKSPRSPASPSPASPNVRSPRKQNTFDSVAARKVQRAKTAKVFEPKFKGRSWKPGQEPGIDPHSAHPGHAPVALKEDCEITVVDFGLETMQVQFLDNDTLEDFLDMPRPPNTSCRWISVNGLSWDVISLLGVRKSFHRLAIEDMLNRRNRTKADWYSDHTYIVLLLQKLVHTDQHEHDNSDSDEAHLLPPGHYSPGQSKRKVPLWRRVLGRSDSSDKSNEKIPYPKGANGTTRENKLPVDDVSHMPPDIRTLQRYHGSFNEERTEYMEEHSALRGKNLAVAVEQVSIFLTSDNTVVSFFEQSAEDVETPILGRLSSDETVLRRTSNASMVVQAIIDAIVDLAMPVCAAYRDAIDDLELNVLTDPHIKHARSLYITNSEISSFRDTIYPVSQLVNALRDHKAEATRKATGNAGGIQPDKKPVTISPWTYAYFGDVEDHVVLLTDNIDGQRRAIENMIDLIFNTIAAYQNESMKQLTLATILFLPLTFLTGYFGMNFAYFDGVMLNSDLYFWYIAIPLMIFTTLWLMREYIYQWILSKRQTRGIAQKRKKRLVREKTMMQQGREGKKIR